MATATRAKTGTSGESMDINTAPETQQSKHQSLISRLVLMAGGAAIALSAFFAGTSFSDSNGNSEASELHRQLIELQADTSSKGKTMSLATGLIDNNRGDLAEGLFLLDHLTGNLDCWVINTRTGEVSAKFSSNVARDMALEQLGDVDYVMVTGRTDFVGANAGNVRPAKCICYVADANSGAVVAYGIQFNPTAFAQGDLQQSEMILLTSGMARGQQVERDQ
ncbi:MAG: hypothetical protein AAF456_15870 [Planctomycetota bacterium]